LFKNTVTLTNTGSTTMSDVRYSRAMDWDIPPTTFREYVTINRGSSSNLLFSNDNGFGTPNPMVNPDDLSAGTRNVSFVDSGPADHGAFFTFGFGALAAGESRTFNIYYGAAATESAALSALGTVGAEVFSLGQSGSGGQISGSPATYIFGFSGVGGAPVIPSVPEPETYAMLLAGLGLLGAAARRKKSQA
jgi:type IV pilus assembly protein PilY1